MAFSLFGKKPEPVPAKPAAKKVAAAQAPTRPAARPPARPTPPPRHDDGESLDFTAPGEIEVHEDDGTTIDIRGTANTAHPVIEEAAILFANSQDEAALATLEAGVAAPNLGSESDQVWAMLFDLYQTMGKRDVFDQRALEYSVKFEKSPPTWVETQRQPLNPALITGGHAYVDFSGNIDASTEKRVRQFEKLAAAGPVARVAFTKVTDVDDQGAVMLRKAMKAARMARCELMMTGADKFAGLLKGKLEVGRRADEEVWLLLLELYQQTVEQDPFEEWALNYAITFEVSPPSWENQPSPRKAASAPHKAAREIKGETDVFPLVGEMFGAGSDVFRQLIDFSGTHEHIVIDCSALKRMDFISAGMLLNTLTNLQVIRKTVLIRQPNQLVWGLFGVLGISQIAQVERRRF